MDKLIKIKQQLKDQKLDGVIISDALNITYLTGYANFSKNEREAYLIITPKNQYIVTDARYSEAMVTDLPDFKLLEISAINPLKKILENLKIKEDIKVLGIEENNLNVAEYKYIKKQIKKLKHFSTLKLRAVKTKEEIAAIEKSCQIGDQALKNILPKIKLGMTEIEVKDLLETEFKKQSASPSFDTIVAFGPHASIPHHNTGDTKLTKEEFILIDMGVLKNNYCSDMTRTVFFGKPTKEQPKIYETVLEAQTKAVQFITNQLKKGAKVHGIDVDKVARDHIISQGYPSIPHSLGHGIGLEVHESPSLSPNSKSTLEEGMIFSIEPGIYLPGFGGVRIEDLYTIENGKLRQLTTSTHDLITLPL